MAAAVHAGWRQNSAWTPAHGERDSRQGNGAEEVDSLRRQISAALHAYPLPRHWQAIRSNEGDFYYWNRSSNQTTWKHPLDACETELLRVVLDCAAAGRACSSAAAAHEARRQRFIDFAQTWSEAASREKGLVWQSEEAHSELLHRLRFQMQTLASLLSIQLPQEEEKGRFDRRLQPDVPEASRKEDDSRTSYLAHFASRRGRREIRLSEDGQRFLVEHMPRDNSCGFHGLGIERRKAAQLLREFLPNDPEIQELVASDLLAALQTGHRASFPQAIRSDEGLWAALSNYYAKQQALDDKRREAKDFLAECAIFGRSLAKSAHQDVAEALRQFFHEMKNKAAAQPSGPEKLRSIQMLGRCKTQMRELEEVHASNREALSCLRRCCLQQVDSYVSWVGSDDSFWLSFVRGCGGSDRGGGLLDALAKVGGMNVRVWADCSSGDRLELVHEASYGHRIVNLWWQGCHFDRLVPCNDRESI